MEKTRITVVDAVMGTGKSTWAIKEIKNSMRRSIVVLPRKSEITRYAEKLSEHPKVVALDEDSENSKQDRFEDALEDANVILITHSLFEQFLKPYVFGIISCGRWHLIMDETINAFEDIKGLSKTTLRGWVNSGIVAVTKVNDRLSRITPDPDVAEQYTQASTFIMTTGEKAILRSSLTKDMLMVEDQSDQGFFTFTLSERRLNVFESVTMMTYMFKDSEMDYWCRMKNIEVDHLELTRETGLRPHSGRYSGKKFEPLVEILESNSDYGETHNHFSASSSRRLLTDSNRNKEHISDVQRDLKRLFKNRTRSIMVTVDDFMFTCLSECKHIWAGKDLPAKFIGKDTWVPYSERGVNGYGHKHNLAYLYNIYVNPTISHTVNTHSDLKYNEEAHALSVMLQWIWRSAIRNNEKIRIYIPSKRMRQLLVDWLAGGGTQTNAYCPL